MTDTTILGLHEIRTPFVRSFLLVENVGVKRRGVVIDSGFIGHTRCLARKLRELGMAWTDVQAILLTHAHLDHTANLSLWKQCTGAPVYLHPADEQRLQGRGKTTDWSRVGGTLEAIGRQIIRYQPVAIDQPLTDGDVLPFWDGLEVIHLPGHTAGHCGFFSKKHAILFSGDLIASEFGHAFASPAIFTDDSKQLSSSIRRAQALDPQLVLTNHIRGKEDAKFTRQFMAFYKG